MISLGNLLKFIFSKFVRIFLSSGIVLILIFLGTVTSQAVSFVTIVNSVFEFTGYGGTGADGSLTVDGVPNGPSNPLYTDNVRTYITAAASGGATSITVNSTAGFSDGDELVIIQMLGTGIGNYETKSISSHTGTSFTFASGISNAYPAYSAGTAVAQVIRVPRYTSVTINSGGYLTTHAFNGTTGGVMFFRANGNIVLNYNATMSGTLSVKGVGYAGGAVSSAGSGPGGGAVGFGGTNTTPGSTLQAIAGSGGGGSTSAAGGIGGGVMIVKTSGTLQLDGAIDARGNAAGGTNAAGGAGGSVILSANQITQTTGCGTLKADGGAGNGSGTAGGDGRIFVQYETTNACNSATPANTTTYWKFTVR